MDFASIFAEKSKNYQKQLSGRGPGDRNHNINRVSKGLINQKKVFTKNISPGTSFTYKEHYFGSS